MAGVNVSSFEDFNKNNEASKAAGGRVLRYFLQRSLIYKMCNSIAVVIGLIVIVEQLLGNAATRKALRRIGDERLAAQGETTEALDEPFDAADLATARSAADNALHAALAHYEAVGTVHEDTAENDDTVSEQTQIKPARVNEKAPVLADNADNQADAAGNGARSQKPADAENASEHALDNANTKPASASAEQRHGAPTLPSANFRIGGQPNLRPEAANAKPATATGSKEAKTPSAAKEPAEAS